MALLTRVSFGARFSLQGEIEVEAMREGRREGEWEKEGGEERGKEGERGKERLEEARRLRETESGLYGTNTRLNAKKPPKTMT